MAQKGADGMQQGSGSWEPTPGGGILRFTMTQEQACALYGRLNTGALRTAAYWRRHWAGWLAPLAAAGLLAYPLGPLPALALLAVALGTRVWRLRHPLHLQSLVGEQIFTLTPEAIYITRAGAHLRVPYTAYDTLRTVPEGLLLFHRASGAAQAIPATAFADAGEMAAFAALLRSRLAR